MAKITLTHRPTPGKWAPGYRDGDSITVDERQAAALEATGAWVRKAAQGKPKPAKSAANGNGKGTSPAPVSEAPTAATADADQPVGQEQEQ